MAWGVSESEVLTTPTETITWFMRNWTEYKFEAENWWVTSVNGQTGDVVISADTWNTKTFYLSNTSDLTTAQAIYDWYSAGKNPIVIYQNKAYVQKYSASYPSALSFASAGWYSTANATYTTLWEETINILQSWGTVTSVQANASIRYFLEASRVYTTPYTPQYDGSPATKKYVDDKAATVMTASEYSQVSTPVSWKIYFIKQS